MPQPESHAAGSDGPDTLRDALGALIDAHARWMASSALPLSDYAEWMWHFDALTCLWHAYRMHGLNLTVEALDHAR
jgi:hypothetical protein